MNTIIEAIKTIINIFTSRHDGHGTGSLPSPEDYRDIPLGAIQKPKGAPDSFDGSDNFFSILPFLDQWSTGSCLPHSIGKNLMFYVYRKTGKIIPYSPRYPYKICKQKDGHIGPGTYPRVAAQVSIKEGFPTEKTLLNETKLGETRYLSFEITKEIQEEAKRGVFPGFAWVSPDIESIKEAIFQNGAVVGSCAVGNWSRLPLKPTPSIGGHATVWYKYEKAFRGDVTDYKIYICNSWGLDWLRNLFNWAFPGRGWFWWSEYKDYVYDILAFTDVPADYLNYVKKMPFKFTKQLEPGMSHLEVRELQKFLNEDKDTQVALVGPGSPGNETIYFGSATKSALIKWQTKNHIQPVGSFGPVSRAKANERLREFNTNAIILHDTAISLLNRDVTPQDKISDNVACAEVVNAIHKHAFGKEIGGGASTAELCKALNKDSSFIQVFVPLPGDIIMSPTGSGNGKVSNGHTGIVTENDFIISNDSPTGLLKKNYTIKSWDARYRVAGGFPVLFFRKK